MHTHTALVSAYNRYHGEKPKERRKATVSDLSMFGMTLPKR